MYLKRINYISSLIYTLLYYFLSEFLEHIILKLNYELVLFYSEMTVIVLIHSLVLFICVLLFLVGTGRISGFDLPKKKVLTNVIAVVSTSLLFVFFVRIISDYLFGNIEVEQIDYSNYELLSIVIIVPITEELFFRKLILHELCENYNNAKALIFSSALFALAHLPSVDILVFAFLGGITSGIIYLRTKSIYYPILFHVLWNTLITSSFLNLFHG